MSPHDGVTGVADRKQLLISIPANFVAIALTLCNSWASGSLW